MGLSVYNILLDDDSLDVAPMVTSRSTFLGHMQQRQADLP